jgi:hypothetical protein
MRFCCLSSLTASSPGGEPALIRRQRFEVRYSARCGQPHLIARKSRTIFLSQIAPPFRLPQNLTEFRFRPSLPELVSEAL